MSTNFSSNLSPLSMQAPPKPSRFKHLKGFILLGVRGREALKLLRALPEVRLLGMVPASVRGKQTSRLTARTGVGRRVPITFGACPRSSVWSGAVVVHIARGSGHFSGPRASTVLPRLKPR